jgi:Formin Homology 2 Domain
MERDGLDSSVMDQDHNLPARNASRDEADLERKEVDSHRRARLHWKTLQKVTSNSMWAKLDQDGLENIEIDEDEFQELFQVEKGAVTAPVAAVTTQSRRAPSVRVIESKRANNGGIILARLKMSHDDLADAVDRINESELTAEQIENLIEYLPTKEERKALESYMLEGGQDAAEKFESLCECEKFMVSMMTVKHAKRKVRALLFKLQFEGCLEDIHHDTVAIEEACDELTNSVRLRQLFGIVLTFGNRLNTAGNGKRKAGAFSLDSLLKLHQAKAFDKKTTFLHYLVMIVQRNNELLLRFKDDIPTVFKSDKVYWDQCLNDLEEVEHELENVRRISLYQARQAHIYRLRRKKNKDDDGNESCLSDAEQSLSIEEEVEALKSTPIGLFTIAAIKYVSALRDKVDETKVKYNKLLEYFGEEDKSRQPHEIFNIIVKFSRDFDKAKEFVFEKEKLKLREERKKNASSSIRTPNGKPPTHSPAPGKTNPQVKLSSHQPSMGPVLANSKRSVSQPRQRPSSPLPTESGGADLTLYSDKATKTLSRTSQSADMSRVNNGSQQSTAAVTSNTMAAMRQKARMRNQKAMASRQPSPLKATQQ